MYWTDSTWILTDTVNLPSQLFEELPFSLVVWSNFSSLFAEKAFWNGEIFFDGYRTEKLPSSIF